MEFRRGLADVPDPQAQQRFGSMNCISWMIGHLAWQEQRYWLTRAQGQVLFPQLNEMLAYGMPASTPPVEEMWSIWRQVTQAADPWLETLTGESIQAPLKEGFSSTGTFLQRVLYHYWYHLGEGMAVRQMLGHTGLPDFVGNIDGLAPYRPESLEVAGEPMDKEHFIRRVEDAWVKWQSLVDRAGEERMLEPANEGGWTLKDVIAHITWHEREMVNVLRTRALVGSDLWLQPLEQRNQAIYEENRDLPLEQALSEAQQAHQALMQELKEMSEEDLLELGRIAEMPPDLRLWDILADNTFQHYLDHYSTTNSWLEQSEQRQKI